MKIVYLSVEYVASGQGHLDRLPCAIRLKHDGTQRYQHAIIDWADQMKSPLTELSRVSHDLIRDHGIPFDQAMGRIRAELSPDTVIVGMNMKRNIHALQLCKNVHYRNYIDLTSSLKFKNKGRWHFLPLATMAAVLGMTPCPVDELDMARFVHRKCATAEQHTKVVQMLTDHHASQPPPPSDAPKRYSIDGVCTSAYNARHCTCQQMSLNPHPSNQRPPPRTSTTSFPTAAPVATP